MKYEIYIHKRVLKSLNNYNYLISIDWDHKESPRLQILTDVLPHKKFTRKFIDRLYYEFRGSYSLSFKLGVCLKEYILPTKDNSNYCLLSTGEIE